MTRAVVLAAALLGLACGARAHTPDTSYARIAIGADAVAFAFTYDLATVNRVARLDANGDNAVSREELAAAAPAFAKFLRENVYLELNDREAAFGEFTPPTWSADANGSIPDADWSQRLVTFTFRNALLHAPEGVAITFDFFRALGERHTVLGTFAWQGRENEVIFTQLEPDYLFDTGYEVPAVEQFVQYLRLGVEHIFRGYDHLAFLLALLFVRRFSGLLKIVTAFTIAHTVTLALAALQLVSAPPRLVESAIAASIVFVALENLMRESSSGHRWKVAGAFGLVHGFGFAAVLRELGLPSTGLAQSLLAFNLGVELGQIAIAAVCWPLLWCVAQTTWATRVRVGIACLLLGFGGAWLADRALALHFMPI